MKRKTENGHNSDSRPEKRPASGKDVRQQFRKGLFDENVLKQYTEEYAKSQP